MYDDAWMPNMQRITWNGIALHGGPLPGYAASHGCVRMPYDFADKLFDKTRIGMRVIISPIDAAPVDFSHKLLFQPNADAIAAVPARAETAAREAADAAKAADEAKKASAAATARPLRFQSRCASWTWPGRAATRKSPTPTRRRPCQDRSGQGARRGTEAEGRRQSRRRRKSARRRQVRRQGKARCSCRRQGRAEGGRDQEGRHRQGSDRGQARA